jgi:SAM-dependent methyltransferase
MADLAGVREGTSVLDVGCGTGKLTEVLVQRVGAAKVTAIDPSEAFVGAARERFPDVRIEHGSAEALPFPDDEFDAAVAQLVVHFMTDPVRGIAEMARVTRPGGRVAACVWDYRGGSNPLNLFWTAVRDLDPAEAGEAELPGTREGHLVEIFEQAGLRDVQGSVAVADLEMPSFDAYWEPFSRGVGPAGVYLQKLGPEERDRLEARARELAGAEPFIVVARAWAARGIA